MDAKNLPIYQIRDQIIQTLQHHNRLIIEAPTGTGKSTQMPQILLDAQLLPPEEKIVVLQPRRVAAKMLATRVSQELSTTLGSTVGFQIRHQEVSSNNTRILFITEGILLRYLQTNPTLKGIGAIIFDEFHERHLYTDLSIPLVSLLQQDRRPDLKIIVMSATLEIASIKDYLNCPTLHLKETLHPVSIEYFTSTSLNRYGQVPPSWERVAEALKLKSNGSSPIPNLPDGTPGSVLIFMPGSFAIYKTLEAIASVSTIKGYLRLPLYGELSPQRQQEALRAGPTPKVIVATNIAETSLTLDGITLVIDSGEAKIPYYDSTRGINSLEIFPISQASAKQRAGRAGRIAPGHVIRLWSEKEHRLRPTKEVEEIHRLDLTEAILLLLTLNINLKTFPWYQLPPQDSIESSLKLLELLGAIKGGFLTTLGHQLSKFPLHPRYSRLLLHCIQENVTEEGILLTSILDMSLRPKNELDKKNLASDYFYWFDPLVPREKELSPQQLIDLEQLRLQFYQILNINPPCRRDLTKQLLTDKTQIILQQALLLGFPDQIAVHEGGGRYRLKGKRKGLLHSSSNVSFSKVLVCSLVKEQQTKIKSITKGSPAATPRDSGSGREIELHHNTTIHEDWLKLFFSDALSEKIEADYNPTLKRILGYRRYYYHDLLLSEEELTVTVDLATQLSTHEVWYRAFQDKKFDLPLLDHRITSWKERINYANLCDPKNPNQTQNSQEPKNFWSPQHEEKALHSLFQGEISLTFLQKKDPLPFYKRVITSDQNSFLEKNYPEELTLSNGRKYRIHYSTQRPPLIRARIQDLFGINQVPTIAAGKVKVLIEILAPNQQPVQITQDLESFWSQIYPKIKVQLQRRYPKHQW
jgi:ATP-dependent helicase HrpB